MGETVLYSERQRRIVARCNGFMEATLYLQYMDSTMEDQLVAERVSIESESTDTSGF